MTDHRQRRGADTAALERVIVLAVSDAAKVFWKWEDEEDDGEGVGPVWVEHTDGTTVDWEHCVRRSIAEAYATEHALEFAPDE